MKGSAMDWLLPLSGGSWLAEPSKQEEMDPEYQLQMRAKAKALEKHLSRRKIAERLGLSPATITRWLGPSESRKGRKRK